jgi:hypothetical protein
MLKGHARIHFDALPIATICSSVRWTLASIASRRFGGTSLLHPHARQCTRDNLSPSVTADVFWIQPIFFGFGAAKGRELR